MFSLFWIHCNSHFLSGTGALFHGGLGGRTSLECTIHSGHLNSFEGRSCQQVIFRVFRCSSSILPGSVVSSSVLSCPSFSEFQGVGRRCDREPIAVLHVFRSASHIRTVVMCELSLVCEQQPGAIGCGRLPRRSLYLSS